MPAGLSPLAGEGMFWGWQSGVRCVPLLHVISASTLDAVARLKIVSVFVGVHPLSPGCLWQ